MLEAMRRGAQGIIAKALFAILILSFAVWGVADVFTGSSQTSIAEVGETPITPDEYQRAFQNELNALSYQVGRRISAEQARAFGLDERVLQRLIGSASVDVHARQLGLALSDQAIIDGLQRDPAFHGPDGKFSRDAVENVMRQLGLTEAGLIRLRRQEELRRHLTSALTAGSVVPRPMVEEMHAYREETRRIAHFTIDPAKIVKVTAPDEAKLKETYETNKSAFVTPEMRKLAVLILSVEDLKKTVTVTDAEAKAAYEQEKATYDTPEKRRIQQISFRDKAAAEAAKKAIADGKSFVEAATASGAKESDIDLGLIVKSQIIDPKIADAAFSLPKDGVSDVIEGRFTTAIVRVTDIEPGVESTFDGVKDKVRDKLAGEKARVEIQKLHDEVDDGRSGGQPLKAIGERLKLRFVEVAATDRTNKTPDGKTALEAPAAQQIVAKGFEGQVGIEQEPVELADGGIAWVDVLSVTPPAQKPLETVKDEVKSLYETQERQRQLREAATAFIERIRKGETIEAVAADAGGKVETTLPVTRNTTPQGLTRPAIAQAFALAAGGVGTSDSADNSSRVVFQVKDITPAPPPTKEQADKIAAELAKEIENDVVASYVGALQRQYGVTINRSAFERLTGTGAQ
ncbi:MAG: SurA N-terminal domain-containing protein [Hyphomicrobiaceae bacterium]|nr:SurA N-terminal domain-containing protein [Hyphomicrobiaceae bacterium]